jgi:hypothetical protein
LLEDLGRLRIVAVFSRPTEQRFDFSTVPHGTTIEERDSKMILSFLTAVRRRVVSSDGLRKARMAAVGSRRVPIPY